MILTLPDKWIRKAISDKINNITVNGNVIPCFDSKVSTNIIPSYYVLMSTQTNQVNELTKCGDVWESSILLDVFTRYPITGNTGSRVLADDITDAVRALVNNLVLEGGFQVQNQVLDFPNDISSETQNENVFRKFIRIELTIN
jgi:hypothetical protein